MMLCNKELGLSHGKVKRLLEMLFEVKVGRSTSCRSVLRTATRLEPTYEEVRRAVRGSPQVTRLHAVVQRISYPDREKLRAVECVSQLGSSLAGNAHVQGNAYQTRRDQ